MLVAPACLDAFLAPVRDSTGAGSSGNMQPFATVTKIIRAI